jgi:hypothetical protein
MELKNAAKMRNIKEYHGDCETKETSAFVQVSPSNSVIIPNVSN